MELRLYQLTDFDHCLAAFDSNTPKYFAPHERADFAEFLQRMAAPDSTDPYFVVIDDAGAVIGCGGYFLQQTQGAAGLSWGMVTRTAHGTGAGRFLLLARLQRICQETAADRVLLNTSQHTYGFFAKVGFVVDKITEDGFGPGLHDYAMTLVLRPGWCTAHGY